MKNGDAFMVLDDHFCSSTFAGSARPGYRSCLNAPLHGYGPWMSTPSRRVWCPQRCYYGRPPSYSLCWIRSALRFLYGGAATREKQALLRHRGAPGFQQAAKNGSDLPIDLKASGIGPGRELWPILVDEFRLARRIVESTIPLTHTGPDKLLDHIHGWLDAHPERKLLLLLDEADQFLTFDATPSGELIPKETQRLSARDQTQGVNGSDQSSLQSRIRWLAQRPTHHPTRKPSSSPLR